ncbi:MAG: lactate utilization protein [Phycisphaerales bacterium]|nr:lactate utilization protein [Phycisphaerales bacterium]
MTPDPAAGASHGTVDPAFVQFVAQLQPPPANDTPLPQQPLDELRALAPDSDLVQRFTAAATEGGWQVHGATATTLAEVIAGILPPPDAGHLVLEPLSASALDDERAAALQNLLTARGYDLRRGHDDPTLFDSAAAITGVRAAIAENGMIVVHSGPQTARGMSLIPPIHVAIIATHQIMADLFDYFATLAPPLPTNITFITGPSKTADIEGVLVTGIHGPRTVHAVLVT